MSGNGTEPVSARETTSALANAESHDDSKSSEPSKSLKRSRHVSNNDYLYFNETDTKRILGNLDHLKRQIYPEIEIGTESPEVLQQFPSVCLVGLGRCGSNVSLDLAKLVHNARRYYMNDLKLSEAAENDKQFSATKWIQKNLHISGKEADKPAFLIEPLIILGDLDKDIEGRVRYSLNNGENDQLKNYSKLKIMDLSEIHAGGAGNAPILGQYLAKIILNKDAEQFTNKEWKYIHTYLVDSCGIKANQSRLFFYIFSAGGGTGSGMASEFGLAQQYSYMGKTFNQGLSKLKDHGKNSSEHSFVFEPIFSNGICILPNISCESVEISEALHINAGRLLCKYLSEEWNFSYNFTETDDSKMDVMKRLRPWNAMMLISNDIMRYAEESNGGDMQNVDVSTMEKFANQYISQQIFNILTAQAVTTDYDQEYFRRAGIDISETIRLDANDLFMSLAGPVTIAYAESIVPRKTNSTADTTEAGFNDTIKLDVDELFFRSIDLPHYNKNTKAIEGISLLPVEAAIYREYLSQCKSNNYDVSQLKDLHFFNKCSSVVSIISLPKDYKLSYMDLNRLKKHLNSLFPNTTLKRYALVIGASTNISLTTLVAKSPCLSDDFLTLIVSYIKRCFAKGEYRFDDAFDKEFLNLIRAEEFDDTKFHSMIEEHEDPAKILDTNWHAIKPMYEKKYRETIEDKNKFISINDIRLSSSSIKGTIMYLREIYRHRISKTKIISLNDLPRKK
ncbi:MAG: hypothetical protein COC19_04215 [SAR86 cluster bacterium]|uniref:Uncharacterized protein n=1 Tax=SAR86 cluster bacterium TaxID=2030880 RepID=A0A2A4MPL6_9GAMM|nr:MAG: hypothetical protein COC19_04215 [SAR86 cluster bacterium]